MLSGFAVAVDEPMLVVDPYESRVACGSCKKDQVSELILSPVGGRAPTLPWTCR